MEKTYKQKVENLKSQPDIYLVNNIKNNSKVSNECLEVLGDRHSGLYISTVSKITGNSNENLKQDLLQEKMYILYHAINTYDSEKGTTFSTHFANEAKWNCLKNKTKKSNCEISCESEIIDCTLQKQEKYYYNNIDDDDFYKNILINEIENIEDSRAIKILKLRYFSLENKNLPWKNIAKEVKLSIQGCINIHDKYINVIKKNIASKYKEVNI